MGRRELRFGLAMASILICVAGMSCRDREAEQRSQEEQAKTAEVVSRLQDICARYKPDNTSFESVRSQLSGNGLFTLEVERLLLQDRERPLIGALPIADVRRSKEGYRLIAQDVLGSLLLSLECSEAQAEYVVNTSKGDIREYADFVVVFRPEAVHRPLVRLVACSELGEDYSDCWIEVEPAVLCVIEGQCLELLYVGFLDINVEEVAAKATPSQEVQ